MQTTTAERVAENESVFRDANEAIVARAAEVGVELEYFPFICECGERSCAEIVRLSMAEYEGVRAHGTHFLIVPGHDATVASGGIGRVVRTGERFSVVEKTGRAGEVSKELDPRG